MTKEEEYFRDQLKDHKPIEEEIIASGFFRSHLRRGAAGVVDAYKAFGYFMALTDSSLFIVKTTAPAFDKPILENKGIERISFEKVNEFVVHPDGIGIAYDKGVLELEMKIKNKYFVTQEEFINRLAERFGVEARTDDVASARKKKKLKGLVFTILAVSIGVIVGLLNN